MYLYVYIRSYNGNMVSHKHFFSKFWVHFRLLIGWQLPTNHLRQRFLFPVITVVVVNIFWSHDPGFFFPAKGNFYFKHGFISLLTQGKAHSTLNLCTAPKAALFPSHADVRSSVDSISLAEKIRWGSRCKHAVFEKKSMLFFLPCIWWFDWFRPESFPCTVTMCISHSKELCPSNGASQHVWVHKRL